MVSFIDQQRDEYGVEPICEQLPIAPATTYECKAREAEPERAPERFRVVESHVRRYGDTPRDKLVASERRQQRLVATSINEAVSVVAKSL